MGPIDWISVILAANLATVIGMVWHGPLFRTTPLVEGVSRRRLYVTVVAVMLIAATMLGHLYARIGSATLAAKPWLYWMQSGGIALAFIVPVLWVVGTRHAATLRQRLIGSGFWFVAYLAMGTVFWALS